ncbi:MAG: prolipoprotein diacylglyceryl transferase [Mangrovibacterium sp.]
MESLFIHWNVNPEIFHIGSLSIRWYGLMFALGFLIGYNIVERMLKQEGEDQKWLDSIFMYMLIATIVGARLGHVFFYSWDYYKFHLDEIWKVWEGGLASHGGAIGIFIALYIWSKKISKRPIFWLLDRVVVPTALVAAMIRFGNLMNSEIYGVETQMPWGFIFERNKEVMPKHPTQIYELLCYLGTFFLLMFVYFKTEIRKREGFIFGLFFVLIFTARFFIEFIKEDQVASEATMVLNKGQWLSIPFVLFGSFVMWRALKNPEVSYSQKSNTSNRK